MSISNTTIEKRIRLRKKLGLNDIKTISNNNLSSKVIFTKTNRSRNLNTELSRVILKGKLFGLINKSNIMTEEQFHDIKIKLSLSKLEKYKESKKKIKENFYYAQKNPNILTISKNPRKFEDDYVNVKDLLHKKFTLDEQRTILSFPQFFQLHSNEFLKELVDAKHKNLYEIIGIEEKKEKKELENLKLKRRKRFSIYALSPKRKSIIMHTIENKNDKEDKEEKDDKDDKDKDNSAKQKIVTYCNNSTNKYISRNDYLSSLFKNSISTNKNKSTNNINFKEEMKTYNAKGDYCLPLIKKESHIYFHDDIGKKYKLLTKKISKKINEKFENMKKRKEMVILNNRKKLDLIKEKNRLEQTKKEKERLKIYNEKKYIEYIIAKLKKNYIQINRENETEEKIIENSNINENNNYSSLEYNLSNNSINNNHKSKSNSILKIDKNKNKSKSPSFH
jgi:hypothetical protein